MTFLNIQREVARNLGLLSQDDTTIYTQGKVTLAGIKKKINSIYQDDIAQPLIRKFPEDFEETTYPLQTYRESFTISASSSGTTLIATNPVFNNSDEGFSIQIVSGSTFSGPTAPAATATINILQYISNTQVVIDTTYSTAWNGLTGFIMGNEFIFNGDISDTKEIINLFIKYQPTSSYVPAELRRKSDLPPYKQFKVFSQGRPWFYETTINQNGDQRGFGILPYPIDYRGLIQMNITTRPPALVNDGDTPQLEVIGVTETLINGTTAWGLRILDLPAKAQEYEEVDKDGIVYPRGLKKVIKNYRPVNRSNPKRLRQSQRYYFMWSRST